MIEIAHNNCLKNIRTMVAFSFHLKTTIDDKEYVEEG